MKGCARRLIAMMALAAAACAAAADFGAPGGPPPGNVDAIADVLRQDSYDLELLISYGTSKRGSAGHLALAIRDQVPGDDLVFSANFYADRAPEHADGFYTDDLVLRIPKKEYLFGTTSSLGETASFGLDFGEVYKRSVIGVRVYGPSLGERNALVAFFDRVNDDYRARRRNTDYHAGEVAYGYLDLNCAKTIGMGFRRGAGYADLEVKGAPVLSARKVKAAATANIPTEMAMKLLRAWNARGYRMDVVLYAKYQGSTYVDPHDEDSVAFGDLPDRFPSVLSRDFRAEQGRYRDFDNLFAMYVLGNMGKYSVKVNAGTRLLAIRQSRSPMAYPGAAERAAEAARADVRMLRGGEHYRPSGNTIEDVARAP